MDTEIALIYSKAFLQIFFNFGKNLTTVLRMKNCVDF